MTAGCFPSLREYSRYFGLNARQARALAKPDVLIMHPGPMNRGVEISPEVADGPRSVILDQVANGVAVRMAVLYLLAGSERQGDGMSLLIQERPGASIRPRDRRACRTCSIDGGRIARSARGLRRPTEADGHRRRRQGRLPGLHRHARAPARARATSTRRHRDRHARGGRRRLHRRLLHAQHQPAQRQPRGHRLHPGQARARGRRARLPDRRRHRGLEGEALAEMGELKDAGCVAVSDDGMLRDERRAHAARAWSTRAPSARPVDQHAEDQHLVARAAHERGRRRPPRSGCAAQPAAAEDVMVARDIELAELTGAPLSRRAHLDGRRGARWCARPRRAGCR